MRQEISGAKGGEGIPASPEDPDAPSGRAVWRTTLLPLLLLAAAVLLFHHRALTYHFWPDDWRVVGPPAAAEFLADPSTLAWGFPVYDHYAPLQKAWFVAQSLLFQDHPLPYHVLNLPLAALAAFALFRLLLKYGLPRVGALCGALYFVIAPYNLFVISWINGSRYLWLSLLIILALSKWEDYLKTGARRPLLAAVLLALAAQYVHSIGVVFPLILGARALLFPSREEGPGKGRAAGYALLLLLAAGVLQVLPRLLLSEEGYRLHPNLSLSLLAQAVGVSLHSQFLEAPWLKPLRPLVLVLFLPLLAAWAARRENWRVMALGIILAVLTLVPPAIMMNFPPEMFSTRMRYMTLPNLGLSFFLGGLVSGILGLKRGKLISPVIPFLAGTFMALLFLQAKVISEILHDPISAQDEYVWRCAEGFRRSFPLPGIGAECRRIIIIDVPLLETAPPGVDNLLIQEINHQTFHRFFRLGEQTRIAVEFFPPRSDVGIDPGDCVYLAQADTVSLYFRPP